MFVKLMGVVRLLFRKIFVNFAKVNNDIVNTNIDYNGDTFDIKQEPLVNIPLSEQTLEIDFSVVENDVNTKKVTYAKNPLLHYFSYYIWNYIFNNIFSFGYKNII